MRCPKCHYLSFDSGERCRNCGYDFSLAVGRADEPAWSVAPEPEGPLADLSLGRGEREAADRAPASAPGTAEAKDDRGAPAPLDLPLFRDVSEPDRAWTGTVPSARPPLAVRRTPPAACHTPVATPIPAEFRLDLEGRADSPVALEAPHEAPSARPEGDARPAASGRPDAPPGRRLLAAALDVLLLLGLDLAVAHLTLKVAALGWHELILVPWVPLAAFLLGLDGAYSVVFTGLGGQTLGKMATGIRVARVSDGAVPGLRRALGRTAACGVSLAPLGLGFLPALVADDRRALHDRLAGTRVVEVG